MTHAGSRPRPLERRSSNHFRVPVQRFAATLTLADGSIRDGTCFRALSEETADLLDECEHFLPFDQTGTLRLYSRDVIAVVSLPAPEETDLGALRVRRPVLVRLRSGRELRGELRFHADRSAARPLDHLNGEGRSFAVHDGATIHLIAKAHVEHVEEEAAGGRQSCAT